MQTPYALGDKMELVLFEKKEHFFITKITEFRDGAGFPFKTIEIGKIEKTKAQPQIQPKKVGPVLTVRTQQLPESRTGAPKQQISGGTAQLPAGKAQPKMVATNSVNQVAGDNAKQLQAGGAKQLSSNSKKRLAAQDAVYLPAGKKR